MNDNTYDPVTQTGWYIDAFTKNKYYFVNGSFHRLDGPAIEYSNGDKIWYINGRRIYCGTQDQFERMIKLLAFI